MPAAPAPPGAPDLVQVHLNTVNPNVILDGWAPVLVSQPVAPGAWAAPTFPTSSRIHVTCVAPCDHPLDRGGHYHITGYGISDTREFGLPINTGPDLTLSVIPGSAPMRGAGAALLTIGILGVLSGLPTAIVGAVRDDCCGLRNAGLGVFGASAALILIGVPLIYLSDTKVLLENNGARIRLARMELPLRSGLRLSPQGLVF